MREYSFVLAGRVGVGKTNIFRRLQSRGLLTSEDLSSAGKCHDDFGLQQLTIETEVGGRDVKVILWDTGGLERYDSMTANYYRNAHAVLLVYDIGAPDTLYCLNEWVCEAKSNNRWSDRLVFAMLGNKKGLTEKEYAIEEEAIQAFGVKHGISPHVNCKVSVEDTDNVQEVFRTIIKYVDEQFTSLGGEGDHHVNQLPDDSCRDTTRLAFSLSDGSGVRKNKKGCAVCSKR